MERWFHCSESERAAFEAGVKLGSIYHQYLGTPVSRRTVRSLERAIEEATSVQPHVRQVRVKLRRKGLRSGARLMEYSSVSEEMLEVDLTVRYRNAEVVAKLRYLDELAYPLMYLERVRSLRRRSSDR